MTRAHVRLLGPCFKTGRKEARRIVADRYRENSADTIFIPSNKSVRKRASHIPPSEDGIRENFASSLASSNPRARRQLQRQTGRNVRFERPAKNQTDRRDKSRRSILNSLARIHGLCPFTPERFHVLLNSLFKVLFNFPSRYLSTIGLVVVL